jgi:hypothetical protein
MNRLTYFILYFPYWLCLSLTNATLLARGFFPKQGYFADFLCFIAGVKISSEALVVEGWGLRFACL